MNQTNPKSNANLHSTSNDSKWLLILMIISLLTIAVHGYLSIQHYQLKLGLAQGQSVCNISATFNCDSVAVSKYATLFGIPMALLGLISQVVFFILLLTVRFNLSSSSDWARRFLLWFSLFVFGTSLVMGSISAFALGTYCLFCMSAYALSIVQLFGAFKIQRESVFPKFGSDIGHLFSQARWVLVLLILIPGLAWLTHAVVLDSYGFNRMNVAIQDSLTQWEASPQLDFKENQGLVLYRGNGTPKITLVEFADFLCPHCKAASPTLEAFTQSHPDVKMIFKVFPLDGKCNKAITHQGDGLRCRLSAAMLCAQNLSQKGWDAHHWIFERQEQLYNNGSDFKTVTENITKDLGLDKAAFETCLNADATNEAVASMAQEGATIGGTPTIFVNGKLLERGQALPVLEALYQKLTR
jgi:protein-disulfide isomerase/uncharacterized membrane protein